MSRQTRAPISSFSRALNAASADRVLAADLSPQEERLADDLAVKLLNQKPWVGHRGAWRAAVQQVQADRLAVERLKA